MKDVWVAHTAFVESLNSESITDYDSRYTVPTNPPTMPEHFDGSVPQVLSPGHAWPGYSYSLTPGQRAWLRDNYALTPTKTVTVLELTCWPGTQHPRMIHLRSDLHVDPRNRRHVLVNAVIRTPGKFFTESAARDAELEAEKLKESAEKEARGEKTRPVRKAPVDISDYMAELESLSP